MYCMDWVGCWDWCLFRVFVFWFIWFWLLLLIDYFLFAGGLFGCLCFGLVVYFVFVGRLLFVEFVCVAVLVLKFVFVVCCCVFATLGLFIELVGWGVFCFCLVNLLSFNCWLVVIVWLGELCLLIVLVTFSDCWLFVGFYYLFYLV